MTIFGPHCLHVDHSEPDERGQAVCASCGAVATVVLTPWVIMDAADSVERNFGPYGTHSKSCVHLSDGSWVCAIGCPFTHS